MHSLVGEHGVVRDDGLVFVNGELWRAHRADGEALELGDDVAVEGVDEDGLELVVAPGAERRAEDARAVGSSHDRRAHRRRRRRRR